MKDKFRENFGIAMPAAVATADCDFNLVIPDDNQGTCEPAI